MIIFLEIDNWTRLSIGAVHYYGKLRWGNNTTDIVHPMSAEEAAYENRKAIAGGGRAVYKPGDTMRGFLELDDLRDFAVRRFVEITDREVEDAYYAGTVPMRLLVESKNSLYPGRVLFGPPDVQAAALALYDRMEAQYAGRSEPRSRKEHDTIRDEWNALIKPFAS